MCVRVRACVCVFFGPCVHPREHAEEVWDLLHTQDGSLYVCGATSMGKDVEIAIAEVAKTVGHMSEADVKKWRETRRDKIIFELW